MFFNRKLRFISITLSSLLALAAFFLLQPMLANAEPLAPPELPSTMHQAANHTTLLDQSSKIGTISGQLSFPSERIPPLTIFAVRIDNGLSTYYSIETAANQAAYTIEVDPGTYNLYAFQDDYASGYTRYVTCGMGAYCSDHSPIPVIVKTGKSIKNIDLADWYAPAGSFPPRPDGKTLSLSKPVCATYHTIRWGETLYKIGLRYNLTWKPIARANNLVNPDLIFAGQVLCIPGGSSTSPSLTQNSNIPTFEILGVEKNKQVTIQTSNFPPHTTFVVTMGDYGTKGINGFEVDSTYSGNGGSFKVSYAIPKALRGQDRIAIRLQSSSGFYSYNWFYNNTTE